MSGALFGRLAAWALLLALVYGVGRVVVGWSNPWSSANLVRELAAAPDAQASVPAPARAASSLWLPSCGERGCGK